jgi:RNA polymerase sigma factor (sigma-70 family)
MRNLNPEAQESMLDQRRAPRPEQRREQLFTERYESLLAWAMRLTNQHHEAADLVQDAFVQFMLGRTGLEQIENIDGYLRRMLKYMHASRKSRQAQRFNDAALSVADYDSLNLGWTTIETSRRMQAIEELQQICSYACARKESSRAGSVLILKYFHEFLATEIAAIIRSSRHCVDQLHALARREVKLFLNEPGRLRFVAKAGADRLAVKSLVSGEDLMTGLRRSIFLSCQGVCLPAEELREIYSAGQSEALTTPKLAHIVSCPSCLEFVNTLLGFPPLVSRYQSDIDSDRPPRDSSSGGASGGGVSGGGGPLDVKKRLDRHLRAISEHKPQELRIAVNGQQVGSLKITADVTELDLNLNEDEVVEFIDITSEQGMLLLFLSSGTGSESEQWAWIELSEGRTLAAFLRLQDRPSLRVVYKDPIAVAPPAESFANEELREATRLSSSLCLVQTVDETVESTVVTHRPVHLLRSWTSRAFGLLKRTDGSAGTADPGAQLREARAFSLLSGRLADRQRLWTRPSFVAALLVAVAVAAFVIWRSQPQPTVTALALLERAAIAEHGADQLLDHVSHRVLNLEERRSPEGAVVSRRRIEIWKDNATAGRVRRLYDDTNLLVAGTWQKRDGSLFVYHHGEKARGQVAPAATADLLLSLEDVWQLDPSAKTFKELIAQPDAVRVERRATTYVLTSEIERAVGASRLLKATLTLSQTDLHPIEQTLLVQRGGELREYRFVEASFELVPGKSVDRTIFDVEPELMGGARPTGRPGNFASRELTSSRVPPTTSASAPAASAELEVDVAYLLNQAKADRNEQVALTRSAGGSLRVEGIVDDVQRKNELLRALAPVSQNPAVVIEIRTIEEAVKRASTPGRLSVRQTEETASAVAVDQELREYFSRQGASGDLDDAVSSFSSGTVNRAYSALFQAIALKRLVNRFQNVDMRTVAPDARTKWLTMIREHARAFERETWALRQDLKPVFFAGSPASAVEDVAITSDADLAFAVERLHKLTLTNNESIRAAFTISSQSSDRALKSSFWRLSEQAQALAQAISRYAN